jgi:Spy/CpxP family protein refolding chaperone
MYMNIVKSRGGMAAIVASLALASATAFAQAPAGGPGGGAPRGPGGGGGGGFGGPPTKEQVMQRQGLTDAALKLSDAQKASLEKLAEKMAADQTALQAKYPAAQGAPPNPEAQAARTKLTDDFTAEVNKVLNDEQKKTWAARPQRGGPGGGGGGAGGPPGGGGGMRGPGGGAGGPPPGGA